MFSKVVLVLGSLALFSGTATAQGEGRAPSSQPAPSSASDGDTDAPRNLPPDLTIKLTPWLSIRPGALLQLRYTLNRRSDYPAGENEITQGFTVPRIRLWVSADITDYISMYIRPGVNADGDFFVEHAFGDIKLGDFSIRGGQFGVPVFGEADNVLPHMSLSADFSLLMVTFDPGAAQGAWVQYNPERVRARVALTNGLRTGFSDFGNEPRSADFAITGVIEGMILGADWSRLDNFTSFRDSNTMIKLGVGVHYQAGGETSDSTDVSVLYLSGDVRAEGDGWNVTGEAVWTRISLGADIPDAREQDTYNDLGFMVQGGGFVLDWLEPFIRYDHIIPDDTPRPATFGGPANEQLRALTTGLNAYVVPRSHMAKVVLEFQYLFDGVTDSLVPEVPSQGITATGDDQWMIRTQITFSI